MPESPEAIKCSSAEDAQDGSLVPEKEHSVHLEFLPLCVPYSSSVHKAAVCTICSIQVAKLSNLSIYLIYQSIYLFMWAAKQGYPATAKFITE